MTPDIELAPTPSDPTLAPSVILTLTLDKATGQLQVNGPLLDKVLTLGMLRLAESVVLDYKPAVEQVVTLPKRKGLSRLKVWK